LKLQPAIALKSGESPRPSLSSAKKRLRLLVSTSAPAINWPRYLAVSGAPRVTSLNLAMPDFFAGLSHEIETTPIAQWRSYLRWQLVHSFAPFLPKAFVDENFRYAQLVSGSKELLPRWRRVLRTENGALGFAVGNVLFGLLLFIFLRK